MCGVCGIERWKWISGLKDAGVGFCWELEDGDGDEEIGTTRVKVLKQREIGTAKAKCSKTR